MTTVKVNYTMLLKPKLIQDESRHASILILSGKVCVANGIDRQ